MSPIFHMIEGALGPVGRFSQSVESDGWIFVTWQRPFVSTFLDTPHPVGIEAQTRPILKNLQTVLDGCGLRLDHAVSVRGCLKHIEADHEA